MKLTKGFEQAVSIVVLLSTQTDNIPITAEVIHNRLTGSHTYIRKITRKLVVANIVASVPGNSGGFTLAKPASTISILDIVQAIEGNVDTFSNFGMINKVFKEMEPIANQGDMLLHNVFREADAVWMKQLNSRNIEELILETLQLPSIHKVDWNTMNPENELLIQKIIKRSRLK